MVILFAENGPNALYSLYLNHCDDVIGCSVHPKYDLAIEVPYMLHVHSLELAVTVVWGTCVGLRPTDGGLGGTRNILGDIFRSPKISCSKMNFFHLNRLEN